MAKRVERLYLSLEKGPATKSDEFSEKFQTAFDPHPHFRKIISLIWCRLCLAWLQCNVPVGEESPSTSPLSIVMALQEFAKWQNGGQFFRAISALHMFHIVCLEHKWRRSELFVCARVWETWKLTDLWPVRIITAPSSPHFHNYLAKLGPHGWLIKHCPETTLLTHNSLNKLHFLVKKINREVT